MSTHGFNPWHGLRQEFFFFFFFWGGGGVQVQAVFFLIPQLIQQGRESMDDFHCCRMESVQHFPGGGGGGGSRTRSRGGSNRLFPVEPPSHIICDFSGGPDPCPLLDP